MVHSGSFVGKGVITLSRYIYSPFPSLFRRIIGRKAVPSEQSSLFGALRPGQLRECLTR